MMKKSRKFKTGNLDSKKGNVIADSLVFIVVLFGLAIVFFTGKYIYTDINTDIQADTEIAEIGRNVSSDLEGRYTTTFDAGFVMVFFLLWLAILFASFRLDTNPIFFAIVIIAMIFLLIVAAIIGNAYEELASDSEFAAAASGFTLQSWIMSHIFETFMVVAFSVIIALYMKSRG